MNKTHLIILAVVIVLNGCLFYYVAHSKSKIGYVDVLKTLDSYNMKKDMEAISEKKIKAIKDRIDSVQMQYNALPADEKYIEQKRHLQDDYVRQRKIFNEVYQKESETINAAMWKNINSEVETFSKEHNIDLLIGANGMGTVMYGKSNNDYTQDFIEYINKRYGK